jgi:hypothetical protein
VDRTGKWILAVAVIITIIGGLLSRWHLWVFDLLESLTGSGTVNLDTSSVALGGLLLGLAPFVFKLARSQGGD